MLVLLPGSPRLSAAATMASSSTASFACGDIVTVVARTGPKQNKPGGVARITKIHDDGSFDVAWVMGGREAGVSRRYIRAFDQTQPSRGRRKTASGVKAGEEALQDGAEAEMASSSTTQEPNAPARKRLSRFLEKQVKDADKLLEKLCKEDHEAYFGEDEVSSSSLPAPPSLGSLREQNWRGDFLDESTQLLLWADLRSALCKVFSPAVEATEPSDVAGSLGYVSRRLLCMGCDGLDALASRALAEAPLEAYRSRLRHLVTLNDEPCVQGEWRDEAYPLRVYKKYLHDYEPAEDLPEEAKQEVDKELATTLPDGYLGEAYSYDDHGISEQWMVELGAAAAEGEEGSQEQEDWKDLDQATIESQVSARLENMLQQVVDRANNEKGTLLQPEKTVGHELSEIPVWGMDCFTRRNIEIALEEAPSVPSSSGVEQVWPLSTWGPKERTRWLEHVLLPAINQSGSCDMTQALRRITDVGKNEEDREAARTVLRAYEALGAKSFRCHPKGTGIVYRDSAGIAAHTFVSKYLGELYPAWRWTQKLEAVEATQRKYGLKPGLPDFYNILLERPRVCPRGYNLLFVEAGGHVANIGSTLSHSCDSNCTTAVVVKDGRLCIALTTTRDVAAGEELTIDYNSVTTSEEEYRSAVCLCGSAQCRGSFLHFSGAKAFPLILERVSGVLPFRNLLKATSPHPLSEEEREVLRLHGLGESVLGEECPMWLQKFAAVQLQYVEFERRKLPLELMRMPADQLAGYSYTRTTADNEARSVMEQRVQSLVTILDSVRHVLGPALSDPSSTPPPLSLISDEIVIQRVWKAKDSAVKRLLSRLEAEFLPPSAEEHHGERPGPPPTEGDSEVETASAADTDSPEESASPLQPARGANRGVCTPRNPLADMPAGVSPTELDELEARLDKGASVRLWDPITKKRVHGGGVKCCNLRKYLRRKPWLQIYSEAEHGRAAQCRTKSTESKEEAEAVQQLLAEMRDVIINSQVGHRGQLKHALLALRALVRRLPRGLGLAVGDVLLLMAHTRSYVVPTPYAEVTAPPIKVRARDLGLKVPVSVLSRYNKEREAAAAATAAPVVPQAAVVPASSARSRAPSKAEKQQWLNGDEVIHEVTKVYPPYFVLAQLLQWHNDGHGTDVEKVLGIDIMGCARLPNPADCFPSGTYEEKHRLLLLQSLEDPKEHWRPWSKQLITAMGLQTSSIRAGTKRQPPLLGSPIIDAAMGDPSGLTAVIATLANECRPKEDAGTSRGKKRGSRKAGKASAVAMGDDVPEAASAAACAWVQCEEPSCLKWRRLPWYVDADRDLGERFTCADNKWTPELASCDATEEDWELEEDGQQQTTWGEKDDLLHEVPIVGQWVDTYDYGTSMWLPGKVLQVGDERAKVHYYRWSCKYDEWIALSENRLAALHSRTRKVRETPSWLVHNQALLAAHEPGRGNSKKAIMGDVPSSDASLEERDSEGLLVTSKRARLC